MAKEYNIIFKDCTLYNDLEQDFLIDEETIICRILDKSDRSYAIKEIAILSKYLIQYSRENHHNFALEEFLQEYPLSTTEGIILMSLAESLLRIPDRQTALILISEQLAKGNWELHLEKKHSWFMQVSSWAVSFCNKMLSTSQHLQHQEYTLQLSKLLARIGENTLILAVNHAINLLAKQFVVATSITEALTKTTSSRAQGYRFSFDMLGEAAMTREESKLYLEKYLQAIENLGEQLSSKMVLPSISVKLSALHPRFEVLQCEQVYKQLFTSLKQLCLLAQHYNLSIVIDAEEADRLEMSLRLLSKLLMDKDLKYWNKLGIAVQAYQKRAPSVIDCLFTMAKKSQQTIIIRLVKGAYWDYEIKHAQQSGLSDFPVFSSKINTELCYMYCVEKLLRHPQYCYPQFATHNAQTIASVYYYAQKYHNHKFEFQQLYGMGESLYKGLYQWISDQNKNYIPCSIYTPIGVKQTLLPYLVRRLIENGANNSFINQLYQQHINADKMLIDLSQAYHKKQNYSDNSIPKAAQLFSDRENSIGINLGSRKKLQQLAIFFNHRPEHIFLAAPLTACVCHNKDKLKVLNPSSGKLLGNCLLAGLKDCHEAISSAAKAFIQWKNTDIELRAKRLKTVALLLETNRNELVWLLVNEAGKILTDALNEVREAIDFCRYYAAMGIKQLSTGKKLTGYTGEENTLYLEARGVILCISPWNFPLAIFTGQISAALMAGNCVIAKPASATPLIAHFIIKLFYQAGFAAEVVQFLPAKVATINQTILSSPLLSGVAFTGSFASAAKINRVLAKRPSSITPLLAETGGINVMLADSSALSEQLVKDILSSAFGSAGQRCSALRLVFIQDDIYIKTLQQLQGAMEELIIDNPCNFASDIGPLINKKAVLKAKQHLITMQKKGLKITTAGKLNHKGENFILPTIVELEEFSQLNEEIFAPILHVISFQIEDVDKIIQEINHSGYGLTFAIHSRIASRIKLLAQNINAGNIYINRNMTGAVVGLQPFGGRGLSGTGPKAGGPHYLQRFMQEKTITNNTACIGGDLGLLNSNYSTSFDKQH
ncbi:MAG: bifunctional proline dehydrogenase/L-glutamate gamma-semialdehyde dehydrogenase PutA [Pseudomonadota bacterium]